MSKSSAKSESSKKKSPAPKKPSSKSGSGGNRPAYSQLELFDDDVVEPASANPEPASAAKGSPEVKVHDAVATIPDPKSPEVAEHDASVQATEATPDGSLVEQSVSQSLDSLNAALLSARVDDAHQRSAPDEADASVPRPYVDSYQDGDALASRLVRASAGTGKTYQLTARLLKILLQGAPPESILATTFTRKAAGEILTKLLKALADAADEENDVALEALRAQVEIPTLPRTVCVRLLDNLLRNIHRLRICTLDSLFAQLARSFPFELGLPPAWRLTDEIEEVWLRERAIESVISSLDPGEMMSLLSMLSKGDVKRSIAFELMQVINSAYSIQRQASPDAWNQLQSPKRPESADLTRAAGYMRQAEPPQKTLLKKLNDMAERIELRQFAALMHETLISNIAKARRSRTEVKLGRSKFPDGLDASFDVLYAAVRSDVLSLLQAQNEATGKVLAAYDHHVLQLKQRSRALGFDDVAVRLANHVRSIDHESLTNRMDGAIDHVLLDEFQDTSPIQWQVLRPLAIRAAAPEPNPDVKRGPDWRVERSFFCVGDTKQAIYGWRGGVAEIFDAVTDQVDGVETKEQNKSFRSSPVVLDVVDRTFLNLHRHPIADQAGTADLTQKYTYVGDALVAFARRFPSHEANYQDLAGHVTVQTSAKSDGSAEDQKNACFLDAANLVAKIHREAPDKTIGVLTRTNKSVAQLIFMLDMLGCDVSQEGGNPLVDSAAVDLVLSALMVSEHPGDKRWAFHIANSPIAEKWGEEVGDNVRAMVEDRGLAETVEYLAGLLAPKCDPRDTFRLKQLTQVAMTYQRNAAPRLRDFVRLVREKRVERPKSARVRVMTVHQSKGLEFDAVVLPELDGPLTRQVSGCVADVRDLGEPPEAISRAIRHDAWHFLPERWQRAFGAQVASEMTESLCLLYVAMTRAKQALHIMISPPKKQEFANKNAASLIFHSLGCDADPTIGNTMLFQQGDQHWHQSSKPSAVAAEQPVTESRSIRFQPLPDVPRRNILKRR